MIAVDLNQMMVYNQNIKKGQDILFILTSQRYGA
ncbi:hypothetical protein M472_19810 [Sphingobacterium paucimobilis HER1398]|uniref:Uncharacterized protein n=1 Tax=Sphingobacterium paucimobilis HER1398 TaxID=1346330 RepID=U2J7W6_9SPHI|nr:hypothetical protein M472_19810 [Sphingobacterium paucimobilis HER1398]